MEQLSTPVIVEHDGWTLASGSQDAPTENDLKEALGAEPDGSTPAPREETAAAATLPDAAETIAEEVPPAEAAAAAPVAEKRRAHDPQKRIDQFHAQLQSERERTARLESEVAALRARTAPPPLPSAPSAVDPAAVAPPSPKPTWGGAEGFEAQGKSWEDYEDAKETWNQEQTQRAIQSALVAERSKAVQSYQSAQYRAVAEQQDQAFLSRVEAVRAKRPDYDKVVENLGDLNSDPLKHLIYYNPEGPAIGLHLAEHRDQAEVLVNLPYTRPILDALRESNAPVKLLTYFAKHPDEFRNLARTDPVKAIAAIGRLEARLDVDPSVTTAAARSVTSARPPLRTVGGGAPVTSPRGGSAADDVEFGPDYVAQNNRQEALLRSRRRGF